MALATYNADGSRSRLQLSQNGTRWTDLALPPATSVYMRHDGELAGGNTGHIFS